MSRMALLSLYGTSRIDRATSRRTAADGSPAKCSATWDRPLNFSRRRARKAVMRVCSSLLPMLLRYRRTVAATARLDALTACVGLGYFSVWAAIGVIAFAVESPLAAAATHWPMAAGVIVLITGVLQFSRWKTYHLTCCRATPDCCARLPADAAAAWRHGVRLGAHCVHCCLGLTVVLLAVGMMDLRAMVLVTVSISIERLAPGGLRAARFIGAMLVATGVFMIANVRV